MADSAVDTGARLQVPSSVDSDPVTEASGNSKLSLKSNVNGNQRQSDTENQFQPKYERKIGHRRTTKRGTVTYRKIETSQLMGSIQLGVEHSIGGLASKPERDLLTKDFKIVEQVYFPSSGSNLTPAHHYSDFRFETYAPMAFRYFRDLFNISPADFLMSMCSVPMRELSNPGASGSIFYLTHDDKFIVKTVERKECSFLQKLLPGYFMNLKQNPGSLLPKFYGLFYYRCNAKNIRLVVMNNLLPSAVQIHQKYDVKGSTYHRKASKAETAKASPTFKDLDFKKHHPEGLTLEADVWQSLIKTLERDTRVLESFEIMDYSLLIAIHKISVSSNASRKEIFNIASSWGGFAARNANDEPLVLFLGLIDILQSYGLRKQIEHNIKAILYDGDAVSVHRPGFYAERFNGFVSFVFRKKTNPLKSVPSKKKGVARNKHGDEVSKEVPKIIVRVSSAPSSMSDIRLDQLSSENNSNENNSSLKYTLSVKSAERERQKRVTFENLKPYLSSDDDSG